MFSCLSLSHIAKSRCVTESADEVKTYGILHRKPMYIKKKSSNGSILYILPYNTVQQDLCFPLTIPFLRPVLQIFWVNKFIRKAMVYQKQSSIQMNMGTKHNKTKCTITFQHNHQFTIQNITFH